MFFCFSKYLFAGRNGNMRKSFTAVARVRTFFFFVSLLRVCVYVREWTDGRQSEGREDSIESSQSFHLLLRHRLFMALGLDKAPDEASRKTDKSANKSGLWLFPRPSFTPFITSGAYTRTCIDFFGATCTLDEFEYRTDRRELLRPAPPVHCEISFPLSIFIFYRDMNEISVAGLSPLTKYQRYISHITFTSFLFDKCICKRLNKRMHTKFSISFYF